MPIFCQGILPPRSPCAGHGESTKMEIYLKKQPFSAFFFRRTRQKSDGSIEIVQTGTKELSNAIKDQKKQLSCSFCDQKFGNGGALETHHLMKHPGGHEIGQTAITLKTSGST